MLGRKISLVGGVMTLVLSAAPIIASTDSGTVAVSASIGSLVKMSGLNGAAGFGTIDLAASAGTTIDNDNICIYSNVSNNYTVTASSSNGAAGAFRMKDSGSNHLGYTAIWYDDANSGAGNSSALSSGSASGTITNADTSDINCASGDNASLRLNVSQIAANASAPASYSDTLTILITST